MKYWMRVGICITVLIAFVFSFAGLFIIQKSFNNSLENEIRKNENLHTLEKYAIETNIINDIKAGQLLTDDKLFEYGKALSNYIYNNTKMIGIFVAGEKEVFSNLPSGLQSQDLKVLLNKQDDIYFIRKYDNINYMFLSSYLNINNKEVYIISSYDITKIFEERNSQVFYFLVLDAVITTTIFFGIFLFSSYISKLDNLVKQKEDFISSFTHEIKTPMTAIIGYASMLKTKKISEDQKEKAARIYIF